MLPTQVRRNEMLSSDAKIVYSEIMYLNNQILNESYEIDTDELCENLSMDSDVIQNCLNDLVDQGCLRKTTKIHL